MIVIIQLVVDIKTTIKKFSFQNWVNVLYHSLVFFHVGTSNLYSWNKKNPYLNYKSPSIFNLYPNQNGALSDSELTELGISDQDHLSTLKGSLAKLPSLLPPYNSNYKVPSSLEEWLESISLPEYLENFRKNGFGSMERVRKMWEVELTTVLEVTKPGHGRRMIVSLGERPITPPLPQTLDPHELSIELYKLVSGCPCPPG